MPFLFLAFEASSLWHGSYPVEVGWVGEDSGGESHLIRPAPSWTIEGWSPGSEAVHGISRARLASVGEDHKVVARRLTDLVWQDGVIGCSDAPEFDGRWLDRLLTAARMAPGPRLLDVRTAYAMACRPLAAMLPPDRGPGRDAARAEMDALAAELVARAEEDESRHPRVRHRALPNAQDLWRTWKAISDEVAARVAAEDWEPGRR